MKIKYMTLISIITFMPLLPVDVIVTNKSCSTIELCALYDGSSEKWVPVDKGESIKISTWAKPLLALRWRLGHLLGGRQIESDRYVARIYERDPGLLESSISGKFSIYADGEYYCDFGSGKNNPINQADVDTNRLVVGNDGKLYYR